MLKSIKTAIILGLWMASTFSTAGSASAADTDPLTNLLEQVDAHICSSPGKITQFYSPEIVIISDDRRVLPENRIKGYEAMLADLAGLKCKSDRKVLAGAVGNSVAYLLADETISVTSNSGHIDERQHSVCTYTFSKKDGLWKITHEHCSSLPDYTIDPGDDALYYFHNPGY